MLWLGVTTTEGTMLKRRSIRMVEKAVSTISQDRVKMPVCWVTWFPCESQVKLGLKGLVLLEG